MTENTKPEELTEEELDEIVGEDTDDSLDEDVETEDDGVVKE